MRSKQGSHSRIDLRTNGKQHERESHYGWLHNRMLIITGKYAPTQTTDRRKNCPNFSIPNTFRSRQDHVVYISFGMKELNRNKTEDQGSYLLLWLLISGEQITSAKCWESSAGSSMCRRRQSGSAVARRKVSSSSSSPVTIIW